MSELDYSIVSKPLPIKVFDYEAEEALFRLLRFIGEDPARQGLRDTPARVIKSYQELFAGYKQDPKDVFKTFEEVHDEMVLLKDIECVSTCEHHMLPFYGVAHIAYIPKGQVIGISKLARLLEIYTRRLQIQERICNQVVEALDQYLKPLGSACIIEAKHLCISCRGVNKQTAVMVTSKMSGVFLDNGSQARHELFSLIKE